MRRPPLGLIVLLATTVAVLGHVLLILTLAVAVDCAIRMRPERTPVADGAGAITDDSPAIERLEGELADLAFRDPLTGLANRTLLHERMRHAATRSLRSGAANAAVLMIDLDDFKAVNDGLGHGAGDALLVAVAERLAAVTRAGDTVARLGGDEFVILAEDVGDPAQAAWLADRVLAAFERPFALAGGSFHCRASVGVRFTAAGALDAQDSLRDADLAMYSAKRAGKGSWAMFERGMQDAAAEQLALRSELHRAIEEEQLTLLFQPIVDLTSERVTGFEALVRWPHPERGLLEPERFIGLAEATGLIHPLGAWVLREAIAALSRMDDRDLTMNVNLSPMQLERSDIVEIVRQALTIAPFPPERLTLEVTESVLLADTRMVAEQLHALRALGVRIALDDFGTGFSSLGYLERLPLDVLKIDRTFVAPDGHGHVVEAIAGLAAGLGLATVAEGIETREQLESVRALGCERGQGFLFAQPLTEADALALLAVSRA